MKRLLTLAMASLLSLSMVACNTQKAEEKVEKVENAVEEKVAELKKLTGQELLDLAKAENTVVIDVRKVDEFAAGHIKDAINIPLEDLGAKMSELEALKDKDIVLYCNSGKRSGKFAEALIEKGFEKVYNAEGVKEFSYELVK